jgi:hypothetical protein
MKDWEEVTRRRLDMPGARRIALHRQASCSPDHFGSCARHSYQYGKARRARYRDNLTFDSAALGICSKYKKTISSAAMITRLKVIIKKEIGRIK